MRYEIEDVFISPSQQAHGLMFREDFPEGSCAVFPYESDKMLSFHGRNCLFPIIAIFAKRDGSIDEWGILEPNGKPISSNSACSDVVELKATEENVSVASRSTRISIGDGFIELL